MNTVIELLTCFKNAPTENNADSLEFEIIKKFEDQELYIQQLRGALGYSVPGIVPGNPLIVNGIAEAIARQLKEATELGEKYKAEAERLFALLDDIDTAEDTFKPLVDRFFNYVHKKHKERFSGPISTDGFVLVWDWEKEEMRAAAASKAIGYRGKTP